MKNRLAAASLFLAFLFSSCSKQLNIYPHSAASSSNLSSGDMELLLTGVYSVVQNAPGPQSYIMNDMVGGNLISARGTGGALVLINGILRPEQSLISSAWDGYYKALYQVNELLKATGTGNTTGRVKEIEGIAHFFRAYLYYDLVTKWGDVPLLKENTSDKLSRTPQAEVWAFIESELNAAIADAPDFSSYYYVSKDAAKALMARVELAQGKNSDAVKWAEEVINSESFHLDSYDKIFRAQQNQEEIFAFLNTTVESSVNISTLFYTYAQANKGSYVYAPASDVMSMYDDADLRKDISISVVGTDPIINKYPSGQAGTDPIIVSRLGEMYLISAEAQGSSGLNRLNDLRRFRGLPDVTPADDAGYQDAVMLERRKELLAEGFRWFDLVRWGKAKSVLGLSDMQLKFPIPEDELVLNNLLKQNPGY
ncbi:MAG TPA: RagB/SusD family nutrient uptake outer membrane protein [Puia sp.]|jgi:hypothetical protein